MAARHRRFVRYSLFFIIVIVYVIGGSGGHWAAGEDVKIKNAHAPLVFSTWEGFEVDKCAAIWLIKKFIDPHAQFKFYPQGDIIAEGIPFDTPDAEMRRTQSQSTFESIARKHGIKDDAVQKMGSIINDIEVNVWGKKVYEESSRIKEEVRELIASSKKDEEVLQKSYTYFEKWYQSLKTNIAPGHGIK